MFGTSEERQRWVVARSYIIQTSSGDLISLKKIPGDYFNLFVVSSHRGQLSFRDGYGYYHLFKKMINMYGTFLCQLLNGNIAQDLKHFLLNKILHLFFFYSQLELTIYYNTVK